ncbi:DUF4279 domain-containing protein [Priestia megaterium]|uniref:DUF4279 domain-containing protein n=1 Tax=Priestia megaterium TaxID=1404 RepID=A0A6H1P747_PRIMG|nr:DUF4279 domain-containing protein [Priestia megaterium]QIZ09386.1 DUF4279 domain-containing protein [Priestia megaterium]
MEESFVAGSFNFIIRGEDLNLHEITKNINLKPSKVRRKGELIAKDIKMKDSYWSYQIKYEGYNELDLALDELLNTLHPNKSFVSEISNVYDVFINLSLRSNLGQLGFDLQPKILKALADLSIRFEVNILSYGEVEDTSC